MRTRQEIEKDARDGRNAFMLMIEVMLDVRQFYIDEAEKQEIWNRERDHEITRLPTEPSQMSREKQAGQE